MGTFVKQKFTFSKLVKSGAETCERISAIWIKKGLKRIMRAALRRFSNTKHSLRRCGQQHAVAWCWCRCRRDSFRCLKQRSRLIWKMKSLLLHNIDMSSIWLIQTNKHLKMLQSLWFFDFQTTNLKLELAIRNFCKTKVHFFKISQIWDGNSRED